MEFTLFRNKKSIDTSKYVIVKYYLCSSVSLRDASWNLAVGQSIGNPNVRNQWETLELINNHSCLILEDEDTLFKSKEGVIEIAFPSVNIDFKTDGISHLLVNIMGGQLDIDSIKKCHILDITFPPSVIECFSPPKYGITGIRSLSKTFDKPLLGSIIKPKTGITPEVLLEMVKELVEGGVNFIKEDEILSDPSFCPIEKRVPLIMDYLKDKDVIYCVSIHSDYPYIIDRVKQVYELGGNGVHVNFWCGLGVYKAIRELDLPIFIHFQKSGDKILTNKSHDYHIRWEVICKLAALMGVDSIHVGMLGGYYETDEKELLNAISVLRTHNVLPALSCGFHPGLVETITNQIGNDYMANVGGAVHGHPMGTKAGALAMRQSIDKEFGEEYQAAVDKWGKA